MDLGQLAPGTLVFDAAGATLTLPPEALGRVKVGDIVQCYDDWSVYENSPNYSFAMIGRVAALGPGSSATLRNVPRSLGTPGHDIVPLGLHYAVTWLRRFHEPTRGNLTAGSDVITGVHPEGAFSAGDRIRSTEGVYDGAYITEIIDASTYRISIPSCITRADVFLYDAFYTQVAIVSLE